MGHLFVIKGDITLLACDAWMLPCDASGRIEDVWARYPVVARHIENHRVLPSLRGSIGAGSRVAELPVELSGPAVWLGDTGGTQARELEWYIKAVDEFAYKAPSNVESARTSIKRSRPLLAIPYIGSGAGGKDHAQGELLNVLLPAVDTIARESNRDIVFVAFTDEVFDAAQAVRRRDPAHYWSELGLDLLGHAHDLAQKSRTGELVVFFGAGVSAGAGLPIWEELLEELAGKAGLRDQLGRLRSLNPLDRARVIESYLEGHELRVAGNLSRLRGSIVERFTSVPRHALGHALLAGLPVREFATLNYDCLFELAAGAARRPVAVLPWQGVAGHARWLLKMHGSVDHPEDIVLTRTDYLRYSSTRGALRGLVQALLITRHMLFVGFGLLDDNFQRIADDVRLAVRRPGGHVGQFGTALTLSCDPIFESLWRDDLKIVSMADGVSTEPARGGHGAWLLDVFLDCLLAYATTLNKHLLDTRFDGMLSDDERLLRGAVKRFQIAISEVDPRLDAMSPVKTMLDDFGASVAE